MVTSLNVDCLGRTFASSESHHGRLSQTRTVLCSHLYFIQAVWLQLGQGQLLERA